MNSGKLQPTPVRVDGHQYAELKQISRDEGVSIAFMVGQGIDLYLEEYRRKQKILKDADHGPGPQ